MYTIEECIKAANVGKMVIINDGQTIIKSECENQHSTHSKNVN